MSEKIGAVTAAGSTTSTSVRTIFEAQKGQLNAMMEYLIHNTHNIYFAKTLNDNMDAFEAEWARATQALDDFISNVNT